MSFRRIVSRSKPMVEEKKLRPRSYPEAEAPVECLTLRSATNACARRDLPKATQRQLSTPSQSPSRRKILAAVITSFCAHKRMSECSNLALVRSAGASPSQRFKQRLASHIDKSDALTVFSICPLRSRNRSRISPESALCFGLLSTTASKNEARSLPRLACKSSSRTTVSAGDLRADLTVSFSQSHAYL